MKNVLQLKRIIWTLKEYCASILLRRLYITLIFSIKNVINEILLHVSLASKRKKRRDKNASRQTRYDFIHTRPPLVDFRFRVSGRCAGGRVREATT